MTPNISYQLAEHLQFCTGANFSELTDIEINIYNYIPSDHVGSVQAEAEVIAAYRESAEARRVIEVLMACRDSMYAELLVPDWVREIGRQALTKYKK